MAFNPEIPAVISTGSVSASRGIDANRAFGELFQGLGQTLDNALTANQQAQTTKMTLDAEDAVDEIAKDRLAAQPELPDVDAEVGQISRFKAAAEQGKIPQSHYMNRLYETSKRLRQKYPMYRDLVDGKLSAAAGTNIGMRLADALDQEKDAVSQQIDDQKKFNRQYAKENQAEIAAGVEMGILPEQNYLSGDYDQATVGRVVGKMKAQQYNLSVKNSELEFESKSMGVQKDKAYMVAQEALDQYKAGVYAVGSQKMKAFLDLQQKVLSDGQVTPEEQMQIDQGLSVLELEVPIGAKEALKPYNKYLTDEQRKDLIAQSTEEIQSLKTFWKDPDTGVALAQERYNKAKVQGETSKLQKSGPILRYQTLVQMGFDKDLVVQMMRNAGTDVENALTTELLTSPDVSLDKMDSVLENEGKTEAQRRVILNNALKNSIDLVTSPATTPEQLDTAIQNLYGSDKAIRLLQDLSKENPTPIFNMLVNPKVTEKMKGTKYWGAYSKWATKQFDDILRPLVQSAKGNMQVFEGYEVQFDEKTGLFNITYDNPNTLDALVMNPVGKYFTTRLQNEMNNYITSMKPIIEESGMPIGQWVANAFETSDIQDIVRDENSWGPAYWGKKLNEAIRKGIDLRTNEQKDMQEDLQDLDDDNPEEFQGKQQKSEVKGRSLIAYANRGATRNLQLTSSLEKKIDNAVADVFGEGYRVEVFSGGQPGKGESKRRTGSIRHDHGKAADVYIYDPSGKRLTPKELDKLKEYWLSNNVGSVGTYMRGGGMHLDEWTKEALRPGMSQTWQY